MQYDRLPQRSGRRKASTFETQSSIYFVLIELSLSRRWSHVGGSMLPIELNRSRLETELRLGLQLYHAEQVHMYTPRARRTGSHVHSTCNRFVHNAGAVFGAVRPIGASASQEQKRTRQLNYCLIYVLISESYRDLLCHKILQGRRKENDIFTTLITGANR